MAKKQPSLSGIIQKNLTSFLLGFFIFAFASVGAAGYLLQESKSLSVPAVSNLFEKKNGTGKMNNSKGTYTVQANDTLCTIGVKLYNNCERGLALAPINNITDPNTIEVGQTLKLTPSGQISAAATKKVENQSTTYVVQLGDDLSKISQKVYGDPNMWERIVAANNLGDSDFLSVGSKLQIPR